MNEFTSLLLKLSNEIEKGALEKMKLFCADYGIGTKRLSEITEAYELFNELKIRNLLGPQNKDILIQLLEKVDRLDLKYIAQTTGSASTPPPTLGPGNPAVVNSILKDSHLAAISEEFGRDWKALGRRVGLATHILANIDDENHRVNEKAIQMILRWKRQNGNDATGQALADALIAIGRRDVAEKLQRVCNEDGIDINIHGQRNELNSRAESGLHSMQADPAIQLPIQESGK